MEKSDQASIHISFYWKRAGLYTSRYNAEVYTCKKLCYLYSYTVFRVSLGTSTMKKGLENQGLFFVCRKVGVMASKKQDQSHLTVHS